MSEQLPYDKTDPKSIEKYAQLLLNQSLQGVLGKSIKQGYKGKGKLGQILEDLYFHYKPNSNSAADFSEAGVELKTSPIKKIKGGFSSKERLVFNIINYLEEYKEQFKTSSFWEKNSLLLLMFYLHEQDRLDIEYIFKIIRLWQFPATDLKIIKDDWEKIITKIKQGKAHEISEADTLYLGACTKGANKTSLRKQPFSEIPAMQRAFSLKSKYLNFIINKSLANEELEIDYDEYDRILEDGFIIEDEGKSYRRINFKGIEPVVKNISEYKPGENFEQLIERRFHPFYGKNEKELLTKFKINTSAKHKFSLLAAAILGVEGKKIEEFEKADVLMKTIRVEENGSIKESMSFKQIQFREIINESWEDSSWFNEINRRFFFVIFKKKKEQYYLDRVMFWNIPEKDIPTLERVWSDTRKKIDKSDFKHFIKESDEMIGHVRPKGRNSQDLMIAPDGSKQKKKCFWLNKTYIKAAISE